VPKAKGKMLCGYPLPCPWHTVVLELEPPSIQWPPDLMPTVTAVRRLDHIVTALRDDLIEKDRRWYTGFEEDRVGLDRP